MEVCRFSAVESKRFGISIARAECLGEVDVSGIAGDIIDNSIDLLILRTKASDSATPRRIAEAGLQLVPADTLVYYAIDLATLVEPRAGGDAAAGLRQAAAADAGRIQDIARSAFDGYRSHYSATPGLSPAGVLEGYVEWAATLAAPPIDKGLSFLIVDNDVPEGFIAGEFRKDGNGAYFEIVLNAVRRERQNRGLYTTGLGLLLTRLKGDGIGRVVISTQVWNFAVQNAWCKLGLRMFDALATYHVRPGPSFEGRQ